MVSLAWQAIVSTSCVVQIFSAAGLGAVFQGCIRHTRSVKAGSVVSEGKLRLPRCALSTQQKCGKLSNGSDVGCFTGK